MRDPGFLTEKLSPDTDRPIGSELVETDPKKEFKTLPCHGLQG